VLVTITGIWSRWTGILSDGAIRDERDRTKALERENKELRRVNEILKLASALFARRSSTANSSLEGLCGPTSRHLRGRADHLEPHMTVHHREFPDFESSSHILERFIPNTSNESRRNMIDAYWRLACSLHYRW
jgi:hypothetical protein